MGTWEHVLPLFVPGYTVLFPTCSDNVLNVPLRGYTCTRILYPVTNSVPTYLRLERPRRRGRSKRPGTLFVTGYNMRVHTANCYPTFPTFDAPNKSQRFFLFPRGYMRVPVYPTYPVAKGIYSFGYQTGRRTGLVLWGKLSLSGKGLGQGFLNVAEMMVLVVFLDSIVF